MNNSKRKNLDKVELINLIDSPNAPIDILELFSKDVGPYVRAIIAQNPNTPIGCLDDLSGDENTWVRIEVAKTLIPLLKL